MQLRQILSDFQNFLTGVAAEEQSKVLVPGGLKSVALRKATFAEMCRFESS